MKNCQTCAHTNCLFYGEDRPPVYSNGASNNCWDLALAFSSLNNKNANHELKDTDHDSELKSESI